MCFARVVGCGAPLSVLLLLLLLPVGVVLGGLCCVSILLILGLFIVIALIFSVAAVGAVLRLAAAPL